MAGTSNLTRSNSRDYWTTYLAGVKPCQFPRFDGDTRAPKRPLSVKVQLDHLPDWQKLSVEDDLTIPVLLRVAWALLLRVYVGSEDVCFGYLETGPQASLGRSKKPGETSVDMSIVRMNLDESISLDRLFQDARQDYLTSQSHRDRLPAETSNALGLPERKLFNTVILIRNERDPAASGKTVASARSLNATNLEQGNVRLHVKLLDRGMSIFLEWWSSHMSMRQAMNVAATFSQTLKTVIAHPNSQILELDYVGERNRQQVWEFNSAPLDVVDRCVHDVIHDHVQSQPNSPAVCAWDEDFTYEQLDQLATRLAHHLVELGVGPEVFVPFCFEKSAWTIVAWLAVLKAGGAFVPLDPSHPIGRLESLARTLRATIVLSSRQHAARLGTVADNILPIDRDLIDELPLVPEDGVSHVLPHVTPRNAAYAIFTSGSTGEPKGTVLEHAAYCSSAAAHSRALGIQSTSRSLQFAAHTFDASLLEMVTTLMVGGCVCVPSEEARLNDIAGAIEEMRVNWSLLTPSFVEFMEPSTVPSLKTLFLGGEAMSRGHIATWSEELHFGNAYGPAECAVVAVVNSRVTNETDPATIGRPVGGHCWVVDPSSHDRLVPVGCIGELLVEGPTLARGYLNDPQKTATSFIEDPVWARIEGGSRRRMYKTGDLVRWNPDGTLNFVGRKDTQVKLHGQRIELGEIEHHLNADRHVKHGLVMLPKSGYCKQRLVSVLSLIDTMTPDFMEASGILKLVEGSRKDTDMGRTAEVRERISGVLPPHMVPSTWIVVQSLPLLVSGKLDRKRVAGWLEEMSQEMYLRISDMNQEVYGSTSDDTDVDDSSSTVTIAEPEEISVSATSELENQLQVIWSQVLNLPIDSVPLNRSWLSLGGDSITAMQVMGRCQKKAIGITVQDILRSKSIVQLASCVKRVESLTYEDEVIERPFDLSPIQRLYFSLPNQGQGHFNQSFFLRLARKTREEDLRRAVEKVIEQHSMLRARFSQTGPNGTWQQRITNNIKASYRFHVFDIDEREQAIPAIAESQASLDPRHGPLFAVDFFNVKGDNQLVSMVAHHLVIDLVSWRVILQDIEELLVAGSDVSPMGSKPLSFQTWCRLQAEHSQRLDLASVLPIDNVPVADFAYWGMADRPNTYGEVTYEGFEVDPALTSLILSRSHETLRTETVDVLVAALIYSFGQVFTDRAVPPIYNEGHGREPWKPSLDLSRTVGWFTAMYPVYVPVASADDLINTVRQVKELRRQVPGNGRPYFASRLLTEDGRKRFGHHWPAEVTFNYLGKYQQLEREGALLRPVDEIAGEARGAGGRADVGRDTPRVGLFEISALFAEGSVKFAFTWHRHMLHQDAIRRWISTCQRSLGMLAEQLLHVDAEATLTDFPLLSLTDDDLARMTKETLPRIGVPSLDAVESAYPCSPMQQGLLLGQTRDSSYYAVEVAYEVKDSAGPVQAQLLAEAWQQVVNRHPALRTVFVENLSGRDRLFDQVVLKNVTADLVRIECTDDRDAQNALEKQHPVRYEMDGRPAHRFTICQTSAGKVFYKLEISHTIIDGASMSLLPRDLMLAYEGRLPKGPGPRFSDFIGYLQDQRARSDEALNFWKSYIADIEPCHFPTLNDGISPEKRVLQSMRLEFDRFRDLQRFCDEHGVTVSNAIHAAWALTLRNYTGSDDTCFGYLASGRDAPIEGVQDIIGPFINMLVCRVNMSNETRLEDILNRVQEDYINSMPYKHTSLADIQHALHLSGTALFNTAISYRKLPKFSESEQTGTSLSPCLFRDPTEYPLSINIEAAEESAAIDLDYWTDSISDGQATNIAKTFIQALCNIIHHSEQTVQELDHLSEHDRRQIWSWNSQMPEYLNECVHGMFEQQARLRPDAPAICAWDANFTYQELDKVTSRLAYYLVEIGVTPETLVPICFDKSAWTIVAMLGILKAGGACVSLDPSHPKSGLEGRVFDTQASVVLAAPQHAEIFEDVVPNVVAIEPSFLDQLPEIYGTACTSVQPTNPCFVIYTSGSTGQPKGVLLEHRAIATSARAHGSVLGIGPDSRVLQFAAYTFDNSLEEIFTTLMRGGCVCVPSNHDRMNNLAGFINSYQVNFMDLTPTVASFLNPSDVPTVRSLVLGAEPLTKRVVEQWGKSVSLHGCYGPSECSVNCTWNGTVGISGECTNIGRSIGSVSWLVHPSNHDRLVPVGCVGELLVEGPILARGYLNDMEKTSRSFIEDPAWAVGEERAHGLRRRMYKTGDLVRYNSDGTLTFLGRKDTQVKLNGQRIELGEIEHHVKGNLPADSQSAVELISTTGEKASKALAAFLCVKSDGSLPSTHEDLILPMSDAVRSVSKELEASLRGVLPGYMVPSVFIPVVQMPMTTSGKLDRRRLRMAAQSLTEEQVATYRLAEKSRRAPSTKLEKDLQKLWEIVLGLKADSVGLDDSFFRLGGDSVAAIQLVNAARSEGIHLTVASIFQRPSLWEMSIDATTPDVHSQASDTDLRPFALLKDRESLVPLIEEAAALCRVEKDLVDDVYPCTSLQQGLIAISSQQPGAYVAQIVYRLPAATIDMKRFRDAWRKVVEEEVILRTRIVCTKTSGFVQVVVRAPIVWHAASNLQDIPEDNRHLPLHDGGELIRYTIVGEGSADPQFVWTIHHALYDGWSIPLILKRVEAAYHDGELSATTSNSSYSRFIRYLSGIDGAESDKFWLSRLSDTTALQFPQPPQPGHKLCVASKLKHTVPLSREGGTDITMASMVRAAWALAVSVYSGSDDVIFGETLTGRDVPVPGIADMIGPTLATVPIRVKVDRQSTVKRYLQDVQEQAANVIAYQHAGLQHIRQLSEDTSSACDFQNLLVIDYGSDEPRYELLLEQQNSEAVDPSFHTYPLTMLCKVRQESVEVNAYYDRDVIPTWQLQRLLWQLESILDRLNTTQGDQETVGGMEILSPRDKATLLGWNSKRPKQMDECIHHIIQQRVSSQPEETAAVCSWDIKLTYRELDRLSTRLAHYLVAELGVGPEVLVPLCFEKSGWTIVAILGVLKAGGAFVPLDPSHPVARLRELVQDVGAKSVLCSPKHHELCKDIAAQAIAIDDRTIDRLPTHRHPLPSTRSDNVAYVIFTSGTTGKPKGVMVEHAAFCSSAAAHAPAILLRANSRVLQFASYTFDASLVEILTTLMLGGCICVPSDETRLHDITGVINEMKVTFAQLTPSFVQLIKPSTVPTLQTLVLCGEPMSQSHISTWANNVNLVNGYGPSECAVVAASNPNITLGMDPAIIGRAVGGISWIVDPQNHNRLAPIGSMGELLVEGPTLARGYLKDEQKTANSFIRNPKWATTLDGYHPGELKERRMYKTGDLVRYNEDGTMTIIGRKDTQAKVRGQRLELGEVEYHLGSDPSVQHGLALIPTSGYCEKQLVAVITIKGLAASKLTSGELKLVDRKAAMLPISRIRERLCDLLPQYMVPAKWVVLEEIPFMSSGKLDRRRVQKWINEMTDDVYRQISDVGVNQDQGTVTPATEMERRLQRIIGYTLNLPAEQITTSQSFVRLGGDSISAMQVMAQCRAEDIGLTVPDILQSKSISQLALMVKLPDRSSYEDEKVDHAFELSPIQRFYFEIVGDDWKHFNQSVLLRLTRKTQPSELKQAIEAVANSHSMLRARFSKDESGVWRQQITRDVYASYRFRVHDVQGGVADPIISAVRDSQESLDIQKGPVFAVDLFNVKGDDSQLLSLAAHHLVIDVVSWRVILQDLEVILESGSLKAGSSLPFQTWCQLELEQAQNDTAGRVLPCDDVPVADLAYWGMESQQNNYGDVITDAFEVDEKTTELLLGPCHEALRTELVDVLLAVVTYSFRRVFSDRAAPAIFNEGHGREPWDAKLDLSRTVGWFTTMSPVYLPDTREADGDVVNAIRWIKDLRRRIPGKGRPYFAYRLLTEDGRKRFAQHSPIEVTFNYLGQFQQFERQAAMLQSITEIAGQPVNGVSDISPNVPRFSLFELSVAVMRGRISFSFTYNRSMKHRTGIKRWVAECQQSLQDAAQQLAQKNPEPTLSDFPLLPLTYDGLEQMAQRLTQFGVSSLNEVEDMYPCSPMQHGILLSQLRNPTLYAYHSIFRVQSFEKSSPVSTERLVKAWQQVVQRHAALRTVFIQSTRSVGLFDQVVVKKATPRTGLLFECDDTLVVSTLKNQQPIKYLGAQLPHQFTICKTTAGQVFCKLEMSHAISDGSTLPVLLHDLAQAYEGRLPRDIGPLYSNYIAYVQSRDRDADLQFWKTYLADVQPCHFPSLNDGVKQKRESQSLSLELTNISELQQFCTKNNVTLASIFQLVWALVLRCYTGLDEVCFGYLVSGRDAPVPGIEDAVGAFINMLICRINLNDALPVGQAIDQIKTDFTQSMAHQISSLAEVQHALHLSGTSLFNTAFSFQNRSRSKNLAESADMFDILDTEDPSEYQLTINVEVFESSILLDFSFWLDNLSMTQAENVASTFEHVLNQLVRRDQQVQTVGQLDFFGQHSRQQVQHWNSQSPKKVDKCMHEIIEQQMLARSASAPAVCGWDGNFTYGELAKLTNRLANHLVSLGVGPEVYVPFCFEKSAWTVVAILAVLKAGGAFVPLDPSHPASRIKHIVDTVNAKLILCSSKHSSLAATVAETSFVVDQNTMSRLPDSLDTPLYSKGSSANAAYIIFTSGTTGQPKGTVIEHSAISTSMMAHGSAMFIQSTSRVLQFASYTFDACIVEILATLMFGGCICVPSEQQRMDNLTTVINDMSVNWALLTPVVARTLEPTSLPTLEVLVLGGEALLVEDIEKWAGRVRLIEAYGPAECSVIVVTSNKLPDKSPESTSPANIGRAATGRVWLVNPRNHDQLVPVGSVGELLSEGFSVAREYINDPGRTANAFISNPAWMRTMDSTGRSCRMFKTGDLARYNSDGTLHFIGRKDTQIKLRGQRIELGEIEHHVSQNLPAKTQSAVELVAPVARNAKALAAFFSLASAAPTNDDTILLPMSQRARSIAQSLEASLRSALPTYMVPSLYVPVTKLPWTRSGKIDRRRLRDGVEPLSEDELAPYSLADSGSKRAPDTEMEKRLQRVWEATLNLKTDSVQLDDDFFRLGGDSVAAIQLVTKARIEGISLTVLDVFQKPKLSDMAVAAVSIAMETGNEPEEPKEQEAVGPSQSISEPFTLIEGGDSLDQLIEELASECRVEKEAVQDVYPCSSLQEGLITLSIKQPGAYVARNVFRLPTGIDLSRFQAAWQAVVERETILRTRFVSTKASGIVAVILQAEPIEWQAAEHLQAVLKEEQRLPAYNGGELTQYTIVDEQESSGALYFVWSIHHALYDGWSVSLLLQTVQDAYLDPRSVNPETVPYNTFIKYLLNRNIDASDAFWRLRLSGASPLQFPQRALTTSEQSRDTRTLTHTAYVSRDSKKTEIRLPTVIRAAWAFVVAAYTGTNDVTFGEILTGRDVPVQGIEKVVGPTIATVPTRLRIDPESSITSYLRGVQGRSVETIPYQHAGLQHIKQLSSDASVACDFQNLLAINYDSEQPPNDLWDQQDIGDQGNFFTYPLVIECGVNDAKMKINATYDENVISSWQVQRLLYQFESVLRQFVAGTEGKDKSLNRVQVFSSQDRDLVRRWNSRRPTEIDKCIYDLFEEKAFAQPHAPAVCAWDGDFTYDELKHLSTKLAHHLVDLGVGPEVFVPIAFDKSAWTIVAILGILKAGGAYVPLNPGHPIARLQEMLRDMRSNVLLCSPQYAQKYADIVDTVVSVDRKSLDRLPIPDVSVQLFTGLTSHNAAYVLFTSGTTGKPKGIVIEHAAFCTSAAAHGRGLLMKPSSRVFQFAAYTFDASVMEILTTLTYGGVVCVPNEDDRVNDVAGAIDRLKADWTFLTPSVCSVIDPARVPTMKVIACGGEALTTETISRWRGKLNFVECYGPTECTIIAMANRRVVQDNNPANIGHCLDRGTTWIVDPLDHNRLAPVGAVGELLIEGPTLARGYLNDDTKTRNAFIENPVWALDEGVQGSTRRFYKTGDLVRYDSDGSMIFIGRKDHQVKLNGQRLELGEIETRLEADAHVQHALVVLPKSGPCKQRLVAILSLRDLVPATTDLAVSNCEIIKEGPRMERASSLLVDVRGCLSDQLPPYMVPTMWVVLDAVPMLTSGKLDRTLVTRWIESVDKETHRLIVRISTADDPKTPTTATARQLQQIWSRVLNLPIERVKLDQSFLSLGGDSITAMQVMYRCRKENLNVTMHDVLKSKSITQLAQSTSSGEQSSSDEEKIGVPFDLSPIQQLYFESINSQNRGNRFNQSFMLRLTKRTGAQDLRRAIEAIISKHSMLRARFSKDKAGVWKQTISRKLSPSYRFRTHQASTISGIVPAIVESQNSIDIQDGPLFAVDLFDVKGDSQIIFLVAHHLVVDMVSWRIILQDLEELLESGTLVKDKPLSFQVWCTMQKEHIKRLIAAGTNTVLPFEVSPANMGYWGIVGQANTYGDTKQDSFSLDEATTALVLGESHKAFRTEPVDLFLAVILHSFNQIFADREAPTVFNEGHGREPWDSTDLSRTVGWFTSMYPIHVSAKRDDDDALETMRQIKDIRSRVPQNGRPYFASRFLTAEGRQKFGGHIPLEILFNYLGHYQQLEHDNSLLQPFELKEEDGARKTSDVGENTSRLALFEVSAIVLRGTIQFSFVYNRRMRHQDGIHRWVAQCQHILQRTALRLAHAQPEPTLSDFPLLPLSYNSLQRMIDEALPQVGISQIGEVEDIYPCSPMQEGLLLSQLRNSGLYAFASIFEVKPQQERGTMRVDAQRLIRAWEKVVARHPALRTVFIESICRDGSYDQVVLKKVNTGASLIQCRDEEVDAFSSRQSSDENQPRLPHRLTVYQTSVGRVLCKMEVNHAVVDGGSVSVIMHDLAMAYDNLLPEGPGPLYSDYIAYIQKQPIDPTIEYWKTYLDGIRPCHFPVLNDSKAKRSFDSVELKFDQFPKLQEVCEKLGVTLANVMQAAWGFVLRKYTDSDDICFGYLTSGRDIPVIGAHEAVGAFINMLVCRMKFSRTSSLGEVFQKVQNDYLNSRPHQHCSLAQIHHELGLSGKFLFNTALSIQNHSSASDSEQSTIAFEHRSGDDPSEYKLTLNVETSRGNEGAVLRFWTDTLSHDQAAGVVGALAQVLDSIVSQPNPTVADVNISIDSDQQQVWDQSQIMSWKNMLRKIVNESMHEVLEEWLETGNLGKINEQLKGHNTKKAIESDQSAVAAIGNSESPLAQVERKLLSLWSSMLNIEEESIGVDDSFFTLGGDSIIAMKMVGIARAEGMSLTVADIFRNPKFSDLAATIRLIPKADEDEAKSDDTINVQPTAADVDHPTDHQQIATVDAKMRHAAVEKATDYRRSTYQPFSLLQIPNIHAFLQEHICPHVHVFRGGIADVLPATDFQALAITGSLLASRWMLNYFFLDGRGPLDLRLLKQSAFRVVQMYEILRTVFVPYENRYFQVVLRKLQPEFHVCETDQDLDDYTAALQQKDRENGPHLGESYVQFTVAKRRNSNHHRIILRLSHAQYDGLCLPAILEALRSGYHGQPIPATPPFSSFVNYSIGQISRGHYDHWRALLKGSSMTNIVHRESPTYNRSSGENTTLRQTISFSSLAFQNITPATVIKAAWALVLAKLTGRSDVVFGHVINGRNAAVPEIENIIGPCLNTVPVRVRFQPNWTAIDLLQYIQDQQVANLPFESLGVREIIQYCTEWPKWTNFTTVVQHQNIAQNGKMQLGETTYTFGGVGSQEDLADLSVLSTPQSNGNTEISLIFSPDSGITTPFATRALNMLCAAVMGFAQTPTKPLPSPSELSGIQQPQPLQADNKPTEISDLSSRLEGLGQKYLLSLVDFLNRAWQQVLGDAENGRARPLHLGSSFFELGGDIMGIAQVAHLLEKEGFKVAVEDLINHPLMVDQLALLTMGDLHQKVSSTSTSSASRSNTWSKTTTTSSANPSFTSLPRSATMQTTGHHHARERERSRHDDSPRKGGGLNDLWKAGLKIGVGLARKKLRQRLENANGNADAH